MIETEKNLSLDALKAGNKEAFARLVDETSGHIYRVGLQITGDPLDAEDVLQETYLKAFRALPEFEGRSSLETWLYRIAVNEALMAIRRRKPMALSVDDNGSETDAENEGMEIVDFCCLPEGELLSGEARRLMDRAIQNLPAALRVVFVMRDLEGLTIQETAEALGLKENNVKTRLLRARLRLRQELSIYYGGKLAEESRR